MSKKKPPEPVKVDEPSEALLDETIDYIIIVETYSSQRSLTGTDQGYACLNKNTGVVELRFGAYSEALQGLMMLQDAYDKYYTEYKKKMGMLN